MTDLIEILLGYVDQEEAAKIFKAQYGEDFGSRTEGDELTSSEVLLRRLQN